jgi:hypothetical protein
MWYLTRVGTFLSWFLQNWFSLLQASGIIGGLLFTAMSVRQATRARRVSDLLTLTNMHRDLWNEAHSRPDLSRVFGLEADLVAQPITVAEERFLNEVIVHFATGWQLARNGSLVTLDAMQADVRNFFSLPIPNAVWRETKKRRDPQFVRFVEECLRVSDAASAVSPS